MFCTCFMFGISGRLRDTISKRSLPKTTTYGNCSPKRLGGGPWKQSFTHPIKEMISVHSQYFLGL